MLLAFKLNHLRIARAIDGKALSEDRRQVVLKANDMREGATEERCAVISELPE